MTLVPDVHPDRTDLAQAWTEDPAQYALASAVGFSGPVWLQPPHLDTTSSAWDEPPRWLSPEAGGNVASRPIPSPGDVPAVSVVKHPQSAIPSLPPVQNSAPGRSVLTLEGALAKRPMMGNLDLPVVESNDVLQPTTVQVVVDSRGSVLPAILLTSSGLASADRQALDLARSARFAPVDPRLGGTEWTWGRMVFRWQGVAPSATAKPGAGAGSP